MANPQDRGQLRNRTDMLARYMLWPGVLPLSVCLSVTGIVSNRQNTVSRSHATPHGLTHRLWTLVFWCQSSETTPWAIKRSQLITVARDRDSDSEDCYVLVVLFIFFRPPHFRHPWADFRENLPHDSVCPEIVYLL